jgi:predicted ATPase/DNA-binding SARP family transcriptional activator
MALAYLQLLGEAQAKVGSRSLPFLADQRYQLLAYLAYHGDWVGRERLVYLFWPDSPSGAAHRNLRRLLSRVQDLKWLEGLEVDARRLRWPIATDVAAFNRAYEAARWEEALSLYRGPLLQGLDTGKATEFTSWLEREREHLHRGWRIALLKRAEALEDMGLHLEAAVLLKALLEGDELDEEALKLYMTAAHHAGGREQALRAYRDFAERLRQELDLAPTSELEALAQAIKDGAKPEQPKATASPTPLPIVTTSFVGRDLELDEITSLLAREDCRLLTLTGMGGSGKTRMAIQVARQLGHHYQDGVAFVPLAALSSPKLIPSAIADALSVSLQGWADPLQGVIHDLGEKRLLLVMDNYEHLLEGAKVALALLRHCPGLKLLVTSRERLDLEEEWLFVVEGMSYPAETSLGLQESQYFDAVRLFSQRVRQVRPGWAMSEADLPHVLEICRLLDGSPLGLELAAVWARWLPLAEIAGEIAENLDFLGSASRGKSERHGSLRAAFEHSWRLLTAREQEVLRKLAVFRGGFRKEAAKSVVGASLPILAALADKSLLRVGASGRYDRHTLIYGYTQEKLAEHPLEEAQTQEAHGAYYLRFVRERARDLRTRAHRQAVEAIDEELDNIRAAWRWAVKELKLEALKETAPALSRAYSHRNREGMEVFARAARSLDEANPSHHAALGYALVAQAEHQHWLGLRTEEAKLLAARGIGLLRPLGEVQGILSGLLVVQRISWLAGESARAKALAEEGLALARQHGSASDIGDFLARLGVVRWGADDFTTLRPYYEEVLAELRELGDPFNVARYLLIFGSSLVNHCLPREGVRFLNESLELARELDDRRILPYVLNELAMIAYRRGAHEEAAALAEEARTAATASGDANAEAVALSVLGRVANALGDDQRAQAYLLQGLKTSWASNQVRATLVILLYFAEHRAAQGDASRAAEWLNLVRHHPTARNPEKAEAQRLLEGLQDQLSAKELAQAKKRAQALKREEVVASLLSGADATLTEMSNRKNDPSE